MKQQLVSSGLALADFIQRHPRRITAAIAALLMSSAGGVYAVAKLAPATPQNPVHLVTESVQPAVSLQEQADALNAFTFTLYRGERTLGASDTPERLLQRLGVADPAAAAFLRADAQARQALFGAARRAVSVEVDDRQALQTLRAHWVANPDSGHFDRLVVSKTAAGFTSRIETAPLTVSQRVANGVIQSSLYAATDSIDLPDAVTRQLIDIFDSSVDFHRSLRKGDHFALIYETLEADGEPIRTGRVLSAEFVNKGHAYTALWFKDAGAAQGSYYTFDGQSLRRAYLLTPLAFSRVASGFGMREHPLLGYERRHKGIDYAAPIGTPVRSIGDGTVQFAGVQRGYGNVIFIGHRNGKDSSVYAHLSHIGVRKGQAVAQGQTIGAVGKTGMATGPHLHFEFRVANNPVNPAVVLASQHGNTPVSPAGKAAFAKLSADMQGQIAAYSQTPQ
ncbi:MAG: M23 family metallopeptidase [Burkholderiaceae bacterium]|jgi:murein DD-endopeptidase MepM/ murein hydrolase activator NlpD|nr:M23 family metallopeptidase [Burkholderiaceae bacterium]